MSAASRCIQCGRELPEGAFFCAFCGKKQPVSRADEPDEKKGPIARAVSESFVWDSVLMDRARQLADTSPVSEKSQVLGLGDLRQMLNASQLMTQHSQPAVTPEPDAMPVLLPPRTMLAENYVIEDQIGSGGMGVVYRAQDMAMHRQVAIKVLHSSLFGKNKIRERFLREAKLMATLTHPNIVRIHDLLEEEQLMATVMQYIKGTNLKSYLEQQTRQLPFTAIMNLFTPILAAMEEAHKKGIIHRDLKPGNILLKKQADLYVPMLTDFGLAKVVEGTNYTVSGVLLGTCMYMSPEQFQSEQDIDQRSDIYALGIILYQLCTGVCPFRENNLFALMKAHLSHDPTPPSTLRADTPPALEKLILNTLAKQRNERLTSCLEFSERLQEALT